MPVEIRVPAMGEGITDVTITRWLKKEGDNVLKDTPIAEIATDKVDSEILSPVDGKIEKILFAEGKVVKIGSTIALLSGNSKTNAYNIEKNYILRELTVSEKLHDKTQEIPKKIDNPIRLNILMQNAKRFISPFIRNIALQKGISNNELETIQGSGAEGRITKDDILKYLENKAFSVTDTGTNDSTIGINDISDTEVEYIELNRIRKVIAKNMLRSKQISPHVTSFVEVNLTQIVNWRNKVKDIFQKKYSEKLTFLPFIIQAVAKALKEFPSINASMFGDQIVIKKNINIGIATAISDNNLIVPVIKNTDKLNLLGITKSLNSLINRARESTLLPEDINYGTFTITNIGTFGNIGGTPIINQPQLAILAIGEIQKKPVAVKTGDNYGVAIQDIAEFWLSYDHRVIDGLMGGSFLKRIANILEQFDEPTNI